MKVKLGKHEGHLSGAQIYTAFILALYAGAAAAQTSMPWESPLCGLAAGFRGPTALAIASIAFFAAGASFLWGEEIAGISKKLVTIFIAISVILGAGSLVGWIAVKLGAGATSCS
jgi:type IV secretion system protein TrbC